MRGTPEERFWDKVDRRGPDECWEWRGAVGARDKGQFRVGGKMVYVTHFSYELTHGKIPDGPYLLSRCKNSLCVNPDHLFLDSSIRLKADLISRFWNKVEKKGSDEC